MSARSAKQGVPSRRPRTLERDRLTLYLCGVVYFHSFEFVDNLVDYSTRRVLLPLLDDPEGEQALAIGQQYFDLEIRDSTAARRYLRSIDDPRLEALFSETDEHSLQLGINGSPSESVAVSSSVDE